MARKNPIAQCLIGIGIGVLLTAMMSHQGRSLAAERDASTSKTFLIAEDGATTFLRGELAYVGALPVQDRAATERKMAAGLGAALAPLGLNAGDLRLRKVNSDASGFRHLRYRQFFGGLEVIGGDLVVHVDARGMIYAINGFARGDMPAVLGTRPIGADQARAFVGQDPRFLGMSLSTPRLVFFIDSEGAAFKAYEIMAEGQQDSEPVRDKVYVDAVSGAIVGAHPQIHFLRNRRVHSASNGTGLPGVLLRSEGQPATGDPDVDAAYEGAGDTYEAYRNFWNRDSFDNSGAAITSSVHYGNNFCNAFWNGAQLVYGDGDPAIGCLPPARAIDVVAHEFTHAVTERESGLINAGESGGLNEAMSDIFGAFTEAWVDGGRTGTLAVSADTWRVGEDVLPPALRYMNDPAADGVSLDYWSSGAGSENVLYSSGIANLAFYLMSQGGMHPRGKSSIAVTGIGMAKAIRVFYKANVDILTANSNFLAARRACEQAALELGYSAAEQAAVADAWRAVGVGSLLPPTVDTLTNGVPVAGLGGLSGSQRFFKLEVPAGQASVSFTLRGGTGDADLYTRFGSLPTTTSYGCRPFLSGNNETCTINNPSAGTFFVMLRGYTAYANATLTGLYQAPGDSCQTGGPCPDPIDVTGLSGAAGSTRYWRITPGPGKTLTIRISGGTGDADLYTRFGARPTTSSYFCRPYLNGNNETCTVPSTVAGDYHIMLRGYTSYSGVRLTATY